MSKAEQSENQRRVLSRGSKGKEFSRESKESRHKKVSPPSRRPYHAAGQRDPETRGTLSSDSRFLSRGTTNMMSSNLGGPQQETSKLERFDSAFNNTHDETTFHTRAGGGGPLSEAGLPLKRNQGIGSGSYYMKPDTRPMLLSEHTFKGREQELSDFANRVATGHILGAVNAEQALLAPEDDEGSADEPGGTRRATDCSEAMQMAHTFRGGLAGNPAQGRMAHTAATKQRYQKKQQQ